jgi:hypothetical protein
VRISIIEIGRSFETGHGIQSPLETSLLGLGSRLEALAMRRR